MSDHCDICKCFLNDYDIQHGRCLPCREPAQSLPSAALKRIVMTKPTAKESAWLKRFRRCISEKPKSLQLHMENIGGELQVLRGDPFGEYELVDTPNIRHFCSEGDALQSP